jgi:Zn-dependent protease with chaperone function
MFGNFIYFIIVLLIYLIYQPPEEIVLKGLETSIIFGCLIFIFAFLTRLQFQRLERRIADTSFSRLDHRFHAVLIQQSVMAIVLFAIDIYGLNLPAYFENFPLFSTFPTLLALLFLGLFVTYLAIVWNYAHRTYKRLYRDDIPRLSYVISNISFSIPVLLPWLLLSGVADLINILPFDRPKWFLNTTVGQVIYFLVFLFGVAIIGPAIIKQFWRCKPLENSYARSRIESLCNKAGLDYEDILYWPIFGGKMITAGVMGLVKRFRYILVTNALLSLLEPEELDMVIAHEIGHIKKKHLIFYLVFFAGFLLISFTIIELIILSIYSSESYYWIITVSGINQNIVSSLINAFVFITLFLLYFRFIFGYFMRNFERQADIFVYSLFDNSKPLVSTFGKIAASSGHSSERPNWHHFSIKERIDYLKKCETDTRWINRHDKKVRNSIAVYLAGMILIGGIGYYLNVGVVRPGINNIFIEKVILKEIEKKPDNHNLYRLLGDLYYEKENYEGVRKAYEKAIQINPESSHVLNNLAWLYATCEDERLRDPERALELARQAAQLERAPHIFDTLAESYFVNGMYEQAIQAAKQALNLAKRNRSYYREQLEKFEKADESR